MCFYFRNEEKKRPGLWQNTYFKMLVQAPGPKVSIQKSSFDRPLFPYVPLLAVQCVQCHEILERRWGENIYQNDGHTSKCAEMSLTY